MVFFLSFPGGGKSQAGHHLVRARFKNNTAQSVQDPTLPPPTTPGAHAADPVAIETAADFSRAGVLGKESRDIQYKWGRQDDDNGGGPPPVAPCARGFPLAAAPVSSFFRRYAGATFCLFTDNSCASRTIFCKIKVMFLSFGKVMLPFTLRLLQKKGF